MAKNADSPFDRALPSNIEAERSILGAILLDNTTINQAAEMLRRDDFFLDSHRRIYDKMLYLMEQGRAIDPITLQDALKNSGDLDLIGGPASIGALIDGVPRFSNIEEYCRIVKGKSITRKLITTSNHIINRCFDAEDEPDILLDEAERAILAIAEDRIRQGFVPISEVAHKQLQHIEEIAGREQLVTGIATGFRDLDYMTSGLQRGDLIIIAARPSMGKCLSATSEIVLEDGSLATIEEICRRQSARLLTLNENWKLSFTQPSVFVDDGIKPVFRVTTKLGRTVESTLTHPFLTFDGWRKLGELKVSDKIAVPREINVFGKERLSDNRIKILAYLIGDGCLTQQAPNFTNTNPAIQADYAQAVAEFPGLKLRKSVSPSGAPSFFATGDLNFIRVGRKAFAERLRAVFDKQPRGAKRGFAMQLGSNASLIQSWLKGESVPSPTTFEKLCEFLEIVPEELIPDGLAAIRKSSKNPLTLWLEEIGLWGKDAHNKAIPSIIFQLTRPKIALFLNRLFATDGWVAITGDQLAQVGYATVSEKLARQLQHMLLRFGVIAKLRKKLVKYQGSRRISWQLDVTHADSIRCFAAEIGIFTKEDKLARALQILDRDVNRTNRDLIPMPIWNRLAELKGNESWASLARRAGVKGYTNIHVGQREMPRHKLLTFADVLDNQSLREIASSDVYWDEIVSIEYIGEKQVYDLTIPQTHNFVANDICVHNTAFCLNIAQNAAMHQQHHGDKAIVGIFSLEMSKEQLVQRMLCAQARIDAHRLRTGMLSKEDWRHLAMGVSELAEAQIFLDDTPAISALEMRAKIRRLKNEQRGLDMIIVDYLQLMSGKGRVESRQQEVSQISRDLKAMAKEMNVPVIALSQLSRAVETRSDHRPQLSDLRESGSIEQDADLVMFIYRDDVYNPETEKQNIAEIIIGKQRNGPIGDVELVFLKQLTRFEDKYRE
jgi:replicative DNA helicase